MTYDATITLVGKDQASPTIDAATKSILQNYKVMNQNVKSVTDSFRLQNQALVATGKVFSSVGQIAGGLMNIYTQFQTQQIRVTDANNQLILAQLNYNQVLAQEGPGTNDAIAASIQLSEAKTNVTQATQQETLGYIGMGLELGTTVGQIINAIPTLQNWVKTLQSATAATQDLNAAGTVGAGVSGAAGPVSKLISGGATTAATVAGGAGAGAAIAAPSLLSRLGVAAAGAAPAGLGAAAGVELLSMMGQQQAGGGESQGVSTGAGALSDILTKDLPNALTNLYNWLSGNSQNGNNSQQTQNVVTVKIENATDNKISTIEQSMGIQQVMQGGN